MNSMYVCIHVPGFPVQAVLRLKPELRRLPVAVLDGDAPLESVFAVNELARRLGVSLGMNCLQASSFNGIQVLRRSLAQEKVAQNALYACASFYSPRIEAMSMNHSPDAGGTLGLDIAGTKSLFGDPAVLGSKLRNRAATCGLLANVAATSNFHASSCIARTMPGVHVFPKEQLPAAIGPLPLRVLDLSPETLDTFHLWGVRTCAQLVALPERDLIARIGPEGQRLRQLALGEHPHLFVPMESSLDADLVEVMELDHPVDLLEPLLFLFSRMIDQLVLRVRSRALGLASISIELKHAATSAESGQTHRRTIRPALPTQDARRLLKLVQLDLETHPPSAAIVAIRMRAVSARMQSMQQGLFLPQSPEPGRLDVLLARLRKLFGDDRVGAPQVLDTHRPVNFTIKPFAPPTPSDRSLEQTRDDWPTTFRVCRPPRFVRVLLENS